MGMVDAQLQKLIENSNLCAYPHGAELSSSRAKAAVIFDSERDCGMQLKWHKTRDIKAMVIFPHAHFFS